MNRIAVYVYYDANGIVQDHAWFCISKLLNFFDRTVVVVNGSLKDDQAGKLRNLGAEVVVRENEGYDFWAYRAGIKHVGFSSLKDADELLLLNSSAYGPIFPIDDVFGEFEKRPDVDFWGLTKFHGKPFKDHIQSYFIVFNNRIIRSEIFEKYWEGLPLLRSRREAIDLGETQLTAFFEKNGFRWDTLSHDFFDQIIEDPSFHAPCEVIELKVPFIKRKIFCSDYGRYIEVAFSNWSLRILEWLKNNSEFSPDLIVNDLMNTSSHTEAGRSMHRTFILSDVRQEGEHRKNVRVAAIIFVYFNDLIDENLALVNSFPEDAEIFFVSSKSDVLEAYRSRVSGERFHFRSQPNRGRNETAYFITCRDVLSDFDYVCLIHDKKSVHISPQLVVSSFRKYLYECLAINKIYVNNIINLFDENPRLGMLYAPEPRFGSWKKIYPYANKDNLRLSKELYEKLKLEVPFDEDPCFPVGSMFWLRKDAMSAFFRHDWKICDFPEEPLPKDGSLLHAMERMYPTFVQASGYISGLVMPVSTARAYLDNMMYRLDKEPTVVGGIDSGKSAIDLASIEFNKTKITSAVFKKICKSYIKQKLRKYLHIGF